MGLFKLNLQPGVNTLATKTLAEGTWAESNLIRFRDGYVEQMFGWTRLSDDLVAEPAGGTARSLHGLTDSDGFSYLAIGSNTNLEVLFNGEIYDITPLTSTQNVAVSMDTSSGSPVVTITDVAHGASTGDEIDIYIPVSVGGLILWGPYVVTVVDVDNYTITASSNATANVTNGGAVPSFTTTFPGTPTVVTVTLANHGLSVNDLFDVQVSTTVGGVVIFGQYLVQTVPTANTFTITTTAASSAATGGENGGNARILYLLPPGGASTVLVQGYGSGTYGTGTWGEGDPGLTYTVPLRYWFLENIGETLMAAVSYGTLYEWNPPVSTRATEVTAAPDVMTAMFVAMPSTSVVALGAEVLGVQDPLLVRWSDTGDYNDWTATVDNQAGSYRLSHGQRIVGGIQGSLSGLIWTDDALWQMQYVGPPFVFTFSLISHGCGLIAPLAAGLLNRDTYWMGVRGFYRYGTGAPEALPCPVWDTVFMDMDSANMDKCICGVDSANEEVYWFYPSITGGTGEIDSYVRLNTEGQWDYGPSGTLLARTAWGSTESALPPAVTLDRYLVRQEDGFTADGAALTGVHLLSGFQDIEDGEQMYKCDMVVPDFKWRGDDPSLEITFYAVDQPSEEGSPRSYGPYTVTPDTKWFSIFPPLRGRQVAVEINSDGLDQWWRLGAVRLRTAPSGRRPQSGG